MHELPNQIFHRGLIAYFVLLVMSPLSSAEIYKWVDANGKTQYSARRHDAGTANVKEVKLRVPAVSQASDNPYEKKWQEQEKQFKASQLQRDAAERERRIAATPAKSGDNSVAICNTARGVLIGTHVRTDGKPLSADDFDTAKWKIKTACR